MNLNQLHNYCITAVNNAEETFFIHVSNPLWDLDKSIIDIELNTLKESIGQKAMGKFVNNSPVLSIPQWRYLENIVNEYQNNSIKKCTNYAFNLIN